MKTKILSYTTVSVTYLLSIALCEFLRHCLDDPYGGHHSNIFFLGNSYSVLAVFGSKPAEVTYHDVDSMQKGLFVALGLCFWLILCGIFNAYCKKRQEKSFTENYRRFSLFTLLYGLGAFVIGSVFYANIDKFCERHFEYHSFFSDVDVFGASIFIMWILSPIMIAIAANFIVSVIAYALNHWRTIANKYKQKRSICKSKRPRAIRRQLRSQQTKNPSMSISKHPRVKRAIVISAMIVIVFLIIGVTKMQINKSIYYTKIEALLIEKDYDAAYDYLDTLSDKNMLKVVREFSKRDDFMSTGIFLANYYQYRYQETCPLDLLLKAAKSDINYQYCIFFIDLSDALTRANEEGYQNKEVHSALLYIALNSKDLDTAEYALDTISPSEDDELNTKSYDAIRETIFNDKMDEDIKRSSLCGMANLNAERFTEDVREIMNSDDREIIVGVINNLGRIQRIAENKEFVYNFVISLDNVDDIQKSLISIGFDRRKESIKLIVDLVDEIRKKGISLDLDYIFSAMSSLTDPLCEMLASDIDEEVEYGLRAAHFSMTDRVVQSLNAIPETSKYYAEAQELAQRIQDTMG